MGYTDILKKSFSVTNRNLLAILVQILYMIAIVALIGMFALVVIAMFAGAFAGLGEAAMTPENLLNILKSSFSIIFMVIIFGILAVIIISLMNALVQSGIIGCLVSTARKSASGFTSNAFFSSVKSSAIPLFWLHIIITLIVLGIFLAFGIASAIMVGAVLIPLRDAGNQIAAFAVGVPFIVVLILSLLIFVFLLYGGGMLASVTLVADRRGASSALGATYDFIKSRFWDVMLFTLLVVFVVICANVLIELVSLPFNLAPEDNPMRVLMLLPVIFITMLLKMYVGLFSQSCFVVYYVSATSPPEPEPVPDEPGPLTEPRQEVIEAELVVEPEQEDRPDTGRTGGWDAPERGETGPDAGPPWGRRQGE